MEFPSATHNTIFDNKVLIITLTVWAVTQGLKVFLGVLREKKFNFKWFIGTGGMPSSHAAGAMALATSCGLQIGFNSVAFALAVAFALVTMFDAQGVRRSSGQQALILNQMIDDIYWQGKFEPLRLMQFFGHTPLEVLIGAVIGMLLSYNLYQWWN